MIQVTEINDVKLEEYPIYRAMKENTLVRFSKWECAKYFEPKGYNYTNTMKVYDRLIKRVDAELYEERTKK